MRHFVHFICRYVSSFRNASVLASVGTTSISHLRDNIQGVCGEPLTESEMEFLEKGTAFTESIPSQTDSKAL